MAFVQNWLIPFIKILFLGGIIGYICFIVGKAFHNAWTKQWKFVYNYKIRSRSYPEKKLLWCMDAMEKGIGWYDAKKVMMVAGTPTSEMNETLWIYDQVINELNNQKGGIKNGRKHQGGYSKIEKQSTELPTI